jgi:hypothetical protein
VRFSLPGFFHDRDNAGHTGYTEAVAKVLISLPDKLLERIDAQTGRAGESRSGFFQRLAERELAEEHRRWRQEIKTLMAEVLATEADREPLLPHIDAAQLIREDRESH